MTNPISGYRARVLGTAAGLLALSAFAAPALPLADVILNVRSVWSGVYTAAQAERGRTTFEQSCAMCHRPDLSGRGSIPALRGDAFKGERHGTSVGELFELVRSTMPPGRSGTLAPEVYADVVAYLLSANAYPPGQTELPTHEESLHGIVFDEKAD
ncbi:MAG: c-type cytochrome [Gemmatimonadales bacterium]